MCGWVSRRGAAACLLRWRFEAEAALRHSSQLGDRQTISPATAGSAGGKELFQRIWWTFCTTSSGKQSLISRPSSARESSPRSSHRWLNASATSATICAIGSAPRHPLRQPLPQLPTLFVAGGIQLGHQPTAAQRRAVQRRRHLAQPLLQRPPRPESAPSAAESSLFRRDTIATGGSTSRRAPSGDP